IVCVVLLFSVSVYRQYLLSFPTRRSSDLIMHRVQTVLFHVGAEISTPLDREVAWKLEQRHIDELEKQIDEWNEQLPELKQFILRSEEHTSELQSREISYAVFCLKKKKK